jgi:plastocyanin
VITVTKPTVTAALFCLVALLSSYALGQSQSGSRTGAKSETQKSQDFVFEARPREIAPGEVAILRWSIKGATRVTIEEVPESTIGRRELRKLGSFESSAGTLEVKPEESTTYVITCEGSTTYTCASATVRVRVRPR